MPMEFLNKIKLKDWVLIGAATLVATIVANDSPITWDLILKVVGACFAVFTVLLLLELVISVLK